MRSLFIAAMLAATSARAIDVGQSPTPFCLGEVDATVKTQAFLAAHNGASMDIFEGEVAAAWVDAFNSVPPASRFVADKIWVIDNPKEDRGYLRVALFFHNETCSNMRIPLGEFEFITKKSRENNH